MDRDALDSLRLHLARGLGRARLLRLLQAFGTPAAALGADPGDWQRLARVDAKLARNIPSAEAPEVRQWAGVLDRDAVRIIGWHTPAYPSALRELPDPPALLYLRGELPSPSIPALAVVGARRASETGCRWTRKLCGTLADAGLAIISGLARGIDTAAHFGCLDAGGRTLAVLGCGIDQIYPPENRKLADAIRATGGIISEYPPGTRPLAGHFPGRNRLISALANGVLVIEAANGSGSLITVDFALEQGREVFAVPGNPLAPLSSGTNQLIKEGAHPVTEARDILDILLGGCRGRPPVDRTEELPTDLDENGKILFKSLTFEPLHIDELARKSSLTPMEVSDILLHLELAGWVEQLPGARYLRVFPTG